MDLIGGTRISDGPIPLKCINEAPTKHVKGMERFVQAWGWGDTVLS